MRALHAQKSGLGAFSSTCTDTTSCSLAIES